MRLLIHIRETFSEHIAAEIFSVACFHSSDDTAINCAFLSMFLEFKLIFFMSMGFENWGTCVSNERQIFREHSYGTKGVTKKILSSLFFNTFRSIEIGIPLIWLLNQVPSGFTMFWLFSSLYFRLSSRLHAKSFCSYVYFLHWWVFCSYFSLKTRGDRGRGRVFV